MKELLILLFTFSSFYGINAQSLSHQTINSAGSTVKISTFSIDYSVGETITETIKGNSNILTQGFIQPEVKIQTGLSFFKDKEGCQFSIFPNPTTEFLEYNSKETDEASFEVYSMAGELVGKYRSTNKAINVSNLEKGTYLIKLICSTSNNTFQKFIKL
jgi:Secretion system C-terminal sorting domain